MTWLFTVVMKICLQTVFAFFEACFAFNNSRSEHWKLPHNALQSTLVTSFMATD